MLLDDLCVAPALRPIELGDDDSAVLQEHLEYAVLVGIELQQSAIAAQADGVERIENTVGGERCEGGRTGIGTLHVPIDVSGPDRAAAAPFSAAFRSVVVRARREVRCPGQRLPPGSALPACCALTRPRRHGSGLVGCRVGAGVGPEERVLEEGRVLPEFGALARGAGSPGWERGRVGR